MAVDQDSKKRFAALTDKARDVGIAGLSPEEKAEYITALSANPSKGNVAGEAKKSGEKTTMRRFAVMKAKNRFNFFRETAQEAKDAAVASKPFSHAANWEQLRRDGYRCVKVEIKVLEDHTQ